MPEGDTNAYAAHRMRPVLVGGAPDEIRTPHPRHRLDRRRAGIDPWRRLADVSDDEALAITRTTFWCPGCRR